MVDKEYRPSLTDDADTVNLEQGDKGPGALLFLARTCVKERMEVRIIRDNFNSKGRRIAAVLGKSALRHFLLFCLNTRLLRFCRILGRLHHGHEGRTGSGGVQVREN